MTRDELISVLMQFDNLEVIVNAQFVNYEFNDEEAVVDGDVIVLFAE